MPIALLAFGPAALAPVTVTMGIYSVIVFSLGVLQSELALHGNGGLVEGIRRAGRAIARSPLIVLSAAGVVWSLLRLPLGGAFDTFLVTLAGATAPCALVAIGLFMAIPHQGGETAPALRFITLKLVVHPLVTALLVLILPYMPPLWGRTAILMAAMPSGASSFVLAAGAGRRAMELSAKVITFSTALAVLSLMPILWWLKH